MKKGIFCLVVVVGLLAAPSLADYTNVRPVAITATGLQNLFSNTPAYGGIYVSGPVISATNDQSPYAVFKGSAAGGSVATMIIEVAGYAGTNRFGIYEYGDSSNKAEIFNGAAAAGAQALISFMLNGDIKVNGTVVANGFGSSFGFYLDVYGGDSVLDYTLYSEDSLNPNQAAQALTYQGNNQTILQAPGYASGPFGNNEFIIAFEDLLYASGDKDFDDMVVLVESITPVPAPGAVLLGMMGLGLIGWLKRRFA